MTTTPEILAPAGDKESFLAAISAGADAIYCGLKELNARMEARNLTLNELYSLCEVAKENGIKVYLALNSLVRADELEHLYEILSRVKSIPLDGIIIQDLSIIKILKLLNINNLEIHLSTLANFSLPSSFLLLKKLNIKRVVIPRELSIDEIKLLNNRSEGVELEVFVHGALCYSVSGRCYWSSMLGGKSALRGRCVQPCRRMYRFEKEEGRFFSCLDLGLDVLTKLLLNLQNVKGWKIEGRKKGAHYVFYTTKAYKILRDNPQDSKAKKTALELLKMNLGRQTTHYFFLSHRQFCPIEPYNHTGSGLFIGKIGGRAGSFYLRPRISLLPKDILRVGYQDLKGHRIVKVSQFVAKGKKFLIKNSRNLTKGLPVFLIERKEEELKREILKLENRLKQHHTPTLINPEKKNQLFYQKFKKKKEKVTFIHIFLDETLSIKKPSVSGLWVESNINKIDQKKYKWCWLPPVMWPEDEGKWKEIITGSVKNGVKNFILNSIWQLSLFLKNLDPESLNIWLGPFCNLTNQLTYEEFKFIRIKGIIPSFELPKRDLLNFPKLSPLKTGIVIYGIFPFSISRTLFSQVKLNCSIYSPKGEPFWVEKKGSNYYLFPAWRYDIRENTEELINAGYSLFIFFHKKVPAGVKILKRKFKFNWDLEM